MSKRSFQSASCTETSQKTDKLQCPNGLHHKGTKYTTPEPRDLNEMVQAASSPLAACCGEEREKPWSPHTPAARLVKGFRV